MSTLSEVAWNAALFKIAQARLDRVDKPSSFEGLIEGISQHIEFLEAERAVLTKIGPQLGELHRQLGSISHAFSTLPGCSEELFLDAVAPLAFKLDEIIPSKGVHIPFLLCVNPTVVGPLQQLGTLCYGDFRVMQILHMGRLKPWPPAEALHSATYLLEHVAGYHLHKGQTEEGIKEWARGEGNRRLLRIEEMAMVIRLAPGFFDTMERKKFLILGSEYDGGLIQLQMYTDKPPAFLQYRGESSMEEFTILTAADRLEAS